MSKFEQNWNDATATSEMLWVIHPEASPSAFWRVCFPTILVFLLSEATGYITHMLSSGYYDTLALGLLPCAASWITFMITLFRYQRAEKVALREKMKSFEQKYPNAAFILKDPQRARAYVAHYWHWFA